MDIKICEKLKAFRKEQGNTQEELANHLGISVQAVSKWERGEGYPDITLLPSIAAYYGKTVDELLGCGEIEQQKRIDEIMEQYKKNGNMGRIEDNIALMRDALKEFPGNLSLMANLAHSLQFIGKEEYADECIEISEKILSKSTDDEQRYETLQTIVYAYARKGNISKAKEFADKLPDLFCTKDVVMEDILEGEEGLIWAQRNIFKFIGLIESCVRRMMLSSKEYTPEEKIFAYETVEKLYKLFLYDGNYGTTHNSLQFLWTFMAEEYAKCGNAEKTVNALKTAYSHAFEIDHFKSGSYTAMFVDTQSFSSECFIKNYEDGNIDLLIKWMGKPVFDFVRDTEGFRGIMAAGKNDLALEF